jgi:maleylacetoacetate isomerase
MSSNKKQKNNTEMNKLILKPKLISGTTSSSSWRVRAALAFKSIEFDLDLKDISRGEAQGISPMSQVPVLEIDGHVLRQSVAIIEYLDHTHPEPPLFPKPAHLKAKVREIVETINSGIQPLQNTGVLDKISKDVTVQTAFAKGVIIKGLNALEWILNETQSSEVCVGNNITAADLFLVPQCMNAIRYGVDLTTFPRCNRIFIHVGALPFMKNTSPAHIMANAGITSNSSSSSSAPPPAAVENTTNSITTPYTIIKTTPAIIPGTCKWLTMNILNYVDGKGIIRQWECAERVTKPAGSLADGVMVVAHVKTNNGKMILPLVSQFRPATRGHTLEFPAGLIDANESPEKAALRELYEETGLTANKVITISPPVFLDPGLSNSALYFVIVEVDGNLPENLNTKPVPVDSVEDCMVHYFEEPFTREHVEKFAKEKGLLVDANLWSWMGAG